MHSLIQALFITPVAVPFFGRKTCTTRAFCQTFAIQHPFPPDFLPTRRMFQMANFPLTREVKHVDCRLSSRKWCR